MCVWLMNYPSPSIDTQGELHCNSEQRPTAVGDQGKPLITTTLATNLVHQNNHHHY